MHQVGTRRKPIMTRSANAPAFAALVVANVALAFGPMFVRLADTGPVAAAFWRMTLALPLVAAMAWMTRAKDAAGVRPSGRTTRMAWTLAGMTWPA